MKMIGAGIGALLLIFALTINSTTSNVLIEFDNGSGKIKTESGIWLVKRTDPDPENKPRPAYCDQDRDDNDNNCVTAALFNSDKQSDCCKALANRCRSLKAFAFLCEYAAPLRGGFVTRLRLTVKHLPFYSCFRSCRIFGRVRDPTRWRGSCPFQWYVVFDG